MRFLLALCLFSVGPAFASALQPPPPDDSFSRALQQAKRVAIMENAKDLPSRAVWLGHRAARSYRLACSQPLRAKRTPGSRK